LIFVPVAFSMVVRICLSVASRARDTVAHRR